PLSPQLWCIAAMATWTPCLLQVFAVLQLAVCSFPEEPGPLISAPAEVLRRYPVFLGRAHRSYTRQEPLYIQTVLRVNRTLYIGARDDLYRVELDHVSGDEMFYSKKRTWESNKNDIRICRMKGKHELSSSAQEECRNYMKVLLSHDGGLFVCGTNAFNPLCANYTRDTLELVSEPIEGSLFTGTVTDFLAIDAVIYRSLGESPALRTIKHDSKWFREPYFVMVSRVARVCKDDLGGSQRVLERQWTSFLKARLNCSIPGDSHFYFNLLQSTSPIIRLQGRDVILGLFSTPSNRQPLGTDGSQDQSMNSMPSVSSQSINLCHLQMRGFILSIISGTITGRIDMNPTAQIAHIPLPAAFLGLYHFLICLLALSLSLPVSHSQMWQSYGIPGSAVCVFDMQQLARVFEGRFKEQKSPESIWTPVPDELVPRPRPGGCAVQGSRFSTSNTLPDEVLNFIKIHPLMDEAVPLLGHRPWIVKTMVRYQLNTMVVDTEAGPHRNRTVVFLGSTRGTVLKCGDDSAQARQPLSLTLDKPSHTLLLAFHSCRNLCLCRNCISSRDPYCGWTRGSMCTLLRPGTRLPFVQDVEYGNTTHLGDCDGLLRESFMDEPESLVTLNLLVVAAVSAFSTGAALSGLAVCWIMSQKHRHRPHSNTPSSSLQRKSEKERCIMGQSRSGSVMSVSRHSGPDRPRSQGETLFVMPNGWVKAGDLDPGLLPTPEQTPLQQKRGIRLSDSGSSWDQSQTYLSSVGTQCPPPPSTLFLSSKLLQGSGRRHEEVIETGIDRQRYVSLSKYRDQGIRPGTLLRKSAGEYNYPMTPQDSPDRRRVVSAPSNQVEYSGEPLRWTHEGYIFSSHGIPPSGHHYTPGSQHPTGLTRTVLHGSRGLIELADFSHLLGKGGSDRTPAGQ
ncbi:hypothetical protein DNTS_025970, partial [Danionella cerebrum]